MSDTEDQLGPLRSTAPVGIPSQPQSGRDRSTRCVSASAFASSPFCPTTPLRRPRGRRKRALGSLRSAEHMFVNEWADLRRESPAWFSCGIDVSSPAATPIFHQMHLRRLPSDLPCCHPPFAPRPHSRNLSTICLPPRPNNRSPSSRYSFLPHYTCRHTLSQSHCVTSGPHPAFSLPRSRSFGALENPLPPPLSPYTQPFHDLVCAYIDAVAVPAGESSVKRCLSEPRLSSS